VLDRITIAAILFITPLAWSMRNENAALTKSFAFGILASVLLLSAWPHPRRPDGRFLPLHALLLLAAASALASRSPSFAFMSLLPLATLWVVAGSSARLPETAWRPAIILSAAAPILLGTLQAAGLDPTGWQSIVDQTFHGRVCSSLGNPNFYSAFLAGTLPFMLWSALSSPGAFPRLASGLLAALGWFSLLHAGSKGGILGAATAVSVLAYGAWKSGLSTGIPRRRLSTALIVAAIATVLGLATASPVVRSRLLFNTTGPAPAAASGAVPAAAQNESVKFRLLTWEQSLRMLRDHPVAGHGLGRFQVAYPDYRLAEIIRMFGQHSYMTDHPENISLELAVELGIAGLGLLAWMLALLARVLAARMAAPAPYQRWFAVSVLAGLAGLFTTNTFGVDIHYGATAALAACLAGAGLSRPAGLYAPRHKVKPLNFACAILLAMAWTRVYASDAALARGIAWSQSADWNTAARWYEGARRLNPLNIIARYFGASAMLDRNSGDDLVRAREWFESVRREAPDYVLINYKMYLLYSKIGDASEAEKFLSRQTKLDPVAAVFFLDRGTMAMRANRYDEALAEFRKAVDAEPGNPAGYQYWGNLLVMQKRYREALEVYGRGIAKKPDAVELYYNSAVAAYQWNKPPLARRYAEALLRLDPGHQGARLILEKLK
jgi:tetratricopeptide (TPR) repeat protein